MASIIVNPQSNFTPKFLKFFPSGNLCERTCMLSFTGSKHTLFGLPHLCNSSWHPSASNNNSTFGMFTGNALYAARSSAKTVSMNPLICIASFASAKKAFQNCGPHTVPWKTISFIAVVSENVPLTMTWAVLGERYEVVSFSQPPLRPQCASLLRSNSEPTLSKAPVMSPRYKPIFDLFWK